MTEPTNGQLIEALKNCHLALSFARQECADPPPPDKHGGRCGECLGCLNASAFIGATSVLGDKWINWKDGNGDALGTR